MSRVGELVVLRKPVFDEFFVHSSVLLRTFPGCDLLQTFPGDLLFPASDKPFEFPIGAEDSSGDVLIEDWVGNRVDQRPGEMELIRKPPLRSVLAIDGLQKQKEDDRLQNHGDESERPERSLFHSESGFRSDSLGLVDDHGEDDFSAVEGDRIEVGARVARRTVRRSVAEVDMIPSQLACLVQGLRRDRVDLVDVYALDFLMAVEILRRLVTRQNEAALRIDQEHGYGVPGEKRSAETAAFEKFAQVFREFGVDLDGVLKVRGASGGTSFLSGEGRTDEKQKQQKSREDQADTRPP